MGPESPPRDKTHDGASGLRPYQEPDDGDPGQGQQGSWGVQPLSACQSDSWLCTLDNLGP